MNDSLFKSDKNSPLRDSGIGGLQANDDLSRKAAETLRNMQREDQREEAERLQREVSSGVAAPAPARTAYADAFGRAVQRGPQLANVFTIKRGNQKYLTGETDSIVSDFWGYLFGIFMVGIFLVVFLFISANPGSSSKPPPPVLILAFFAFDAVLVGLMIRSVMQANYFAKNGTLLMGTVGSADGRWVTTGSGKNRSRKYRVTLNYRVSLPDGEVVNKSETHDRNDLARGGLPEPGAPVAVLYVPDTKKMRLL
jgi:hypothetical protein